MDQMKFTKILGAACASLLVFLLAKEVGGMIFSVGGHGHDEHQAYTIEVAGGAVEEEVEIDLDAMMAVADAGAGERVFAKCKACHAIEAGKNGTGPSLHGLEGRQPGAAEGFAFSDAMVAYGSQIGAWDNAHLFEFLGNVKGTVPGTKMTFAGISDVEDRANLIAYLDTLK